MRQNKRFQKTDFDMGRMMRYFNGDWHTNNSIFFLRIKNSGFDGKLVFVNVLMCYENDKNCEVVLTMSQKVAEHLLDRLQNLKLKSLKGGKKNEGRIELHSDL